MSESAPQDHPRSVGRRAARALLSRRAAILVMGLMAGMLSLAALVPDTGTVDAAAWDRLREQRPIVSWIGRNLRPQDVVRHPAFAVLPAFLFLSITLSVAQRTREAWRQRRGSAARPRLERFRVERCVTVPGTPPAAAAVVLEVLARQGYRAAGDGDELGGRRGAAGTWGSLVFHLGLLLVLVGVCVSALTRMNGEIVLTENHPAAFAPASFIWLSPAARLPRAPGAALSIRDFIAEYSPTGSPKDYSVLLSVHDGERRVREAQVRVNQAFHWAGLQLTLHRYGFAADLSARDAAGRDQLDVVGVLRVLPPGQEDRLPLRDGGSLRLRLYPDFTTADGAPASRSLDPRRPVLLWRWVDAAGRTRASGEVAQGESSAVAGHRVSFRALSYWAGFNVSIDHGLWLFIIGSVLGSLGIGLRLAVPDQAVRATLRPAAPDGDATEVQLVASTRFFPVLYEQRVDTMVEAIAARAQRGGVAMLPSSKL